MIFQNIPSGRALADPAFNKAQKIDMLIGAEIVSEIFINESLKLDKLLPLLQNTALGWIVTGKLSAPSQVSLLCKQNTNVSTADLDIILRQFWEIESSTSSKRETIEEKLCEQHFKSTVQQYGSGRFIVKLPFKSPTTILGDSLTTAKRRKLQKNLDLKRQYCDNIGISKLKPYELYCNTL